MFYIYIGLLQIGVEGEYNEAGVGLEGDDEEENEEDHKVYGDMQHCPEAQPGEPSCHQICHSESWDSQASPGPGLVMFHVSLTQSHNESQQTKQVEDFPDIDPDLLVEKVTVRFSLV